MGAVLFHEDTRTDEHDEGNSRVSQFWERV
jgi:hypothetical protein